MSLPSRVSIKASIVYLVIGAVIGALLLINRWIPLDPKILLLKSSHVQTLVVGWLTQLILGVGWWLFPPLPRHPVSEGDGRVRRGQRQRGSEPLFWLTLASLNAGVLLRSVGDPLYGWTGIEVFNALAGLSGLFLFAAAVSFVANVWNRVRELGRRT